VDNPAMALRRSPFMVNFRLADDSGLNGNGENFWDKKYLQTWKIQ
jgi:hypothetical protein